MATVRHLLKFANKVGVVTGASSGIGAATCRELAKNGATLAMTGRKYGNLEKTLEGCDGSDHLLIEADLTKEDDVRKIVQQTIKKYGRLDLLVNNAGIIVEGSIENTDLEQFDRMMNTNVRSVYHLTFLAVPYLISSQGNIINVSSVNGIRSFPGVNAYCMSKAALDQFTACTALELADKGVRVNSVNPGTIITNLHKRGGMTGERYEEFLEKCKLTHPLGRPGQAEEVAKAIAFLASDDASFTTGQCLSVDGGRFRLCPR